MANRYEFVFLQEARKYPSATVYSFLRLMGRDSTVCQFYIATALMMWRKLLCTCSFYCKVPLWKDLCCYIKYQSYTFVSVPGPVNLWLDWILIKSWENLKLKKKKEQHYSDELNDTDVVQALSEADLKHSTL